MLLGYQLIFPFLLFSLALQSASPVSIGFLLYNFFFS